MAVKTKILDVLKEARTLDNNRQPAIDLLTPRNRRYIEITRRFVIERIEILLVWAIPTIARWSLGNKFMQVGACFSHSCHRTPQACLHPLTDFEDLVSIWSSQQEQSVSNNNLEYFELTWHSVSGKSILMKFDRYYDFYKRMQVIDFLKICEYFCDMN